MKVTVFKYSDYVQFLNDWIQSRPKKGRGIKAQMAHSIGCNPVHITRVLQKSAVLTMEQAVRVNIFLELSNLEDRYFMSLVEMARAGNNELKEFVKRRLVEIKEQWEQSHRGHKGKTLGLSREDYEIYYGSWIYEALDKLASIPKYQKLDSMCEYLNLSKKEVLAALNFLLEKDLIKKEGNRYIRDLRNTLDNPPGHIFWTKHHMNWRNKAVASFDDREENNLSINILTSLSEKDIPRLINFLHEKSAELIESVKDSPREELRCICIDFFKVK